MPIRDDLLVRGELPDIYFIRHGQTDWNAQGRYQGQKDIALNKKGRGQASANGVLLTDLLSKAELDPNEMDWYASSLSRAIDTMELIRSNFSGLSKKVKIDKSLIEVSFGEHEGSLYRDLTSDFAKRGERDESFWGHRPKGGESYIDLVDRIEPFISNITKPSIIVSHGGIARVFRYLLEGLPKIDVVNMATPQDAILHFSKGKLNIIKSRND